MKLSFPFFLLLQKQRVRLLRLVVVVVVVVAGFVDHGHPTDAFTLPQIILPPIPNIVQNIQKGYHQRIIADPTFLQKSMTELILAVTTQLTAEYERRGGLTQLITEFDFVLAGILTAVFGKYYSMWSVAPTQTGVEEIGTAVVVHKDDDDDDNDHKNLRGMQNQDDPHFFHMKVPTNAFQRTMLDGVTPPKLKQRIASFFVPMIPLFQAGFLASSVGYGSVRIMIFIRAWLIPSYVTQTQTVNVFYASIYTGVFMAIVSNIRYQILQGLIEPWIEHMFHHHHRHHHLAMFLRGILIFMIRVGNGLLGSILAIAGMKQIGLQQIKS